MEGRLKQTIRHPKMEVLVDFNGLGLDRVNEWENITDYVLDISGSKEKAGEAVGGVTSDIVTFATDNKGNVFSNNNVNSPFYQKVKSNVDFVLKTGFKGEELKIYAAGIITKFAPSWNDKKYNVSAEDYFYKLKNTDAPKTAYQDISLDELVNLLLDEAGIPSQINRIIPKTEFNFNYFKFEEPTCFDALKKLMEISVGQAYFEGLNFVFETKLALDYELDLTVKHTVEEDDIFTFDETVEDTDIINAVSIVSNPKTIYPKELVFATPENIVQVQEEPITFGSGTYFYIDPTHLPIINNAEQPISVKNLTQGRTINIYSVDINTGKITIAPESLAYVATGDLLVVSYSYQQLVLLAGQSRTFSLNLTGEVHALTDVDVAVWDATGQIQKVYSNVPNTSNSVSLQQFTFNQTSGLVTVVLKNNYTEGITISTLQLRGNPIKSANPLEIYVRDLPSIDEYQKKELQITNNYFTNTKLTQKIAQYIVDNRSQPRKKINVDMDGYTEFELNDITKVIENESGTDHTFYADRIDYSFNSDSGWMAKVTLTQTETEQWVYESFKGESWEKTNPGTPIDDFIFNINANMIKNGGAELHTGIADYADAGAIGSAHYVPDYWRFTRLTGNASARIRTGGELALHADQSFEITTSNSGSGYYEQTLSGVVPSKAHSASFLARLDGCSGEFIIEQYANTTLIKTDTFDLVEGYKDYEFQFSSEATCTSFIVKFKKKAGTNGSESMIFDAVKVEEADKASLYVEAQETQTVQAGQKYDNSVIIGNNYGISVYDADDNQRVRMGQYEPGKYGMRIDNGALEIVNGLLYEQLASDIGEKLDISENNAITSLSMSMSSMNDVVTGHTSLIQQNSEQIQLRVLDETYQTDKNGILQRLSSAETNITQNAHDITLMATYEQLSELGDTVAENTAAINLNATAITSKVEQNDFNLLSGTVSNHTSLISQHATDISLRVLSTDYNGNKIASLINQTATTITIQAAKIALDGYVEAKHIKTLNGLTTANGQLVIDANGNLKIGSGATLTAVNIVAGKFDGMSGNTIYFGQYGGKVDTSIAGTIKRTRFATNDATYLAIDDDGRFNFVMNTNFDVYAAPSVSGGHYVFKLGSAMIKGLGSGGVMQVRNYDDSLYGDLAAKDVTATGNLSVWGRGTISGTDLTINGTTSGMLKLKGSPYAFMEFYNGSTQVGFVGTETASGSNSIMLQNNNNGEVVVKTGAVRVKFDKSVGQVVFKDQNDNGYISLVAKELIPNSLRERKKDITPFTLTSTGRTALEEMCDTTVFRYRFIEETDIDPLRIGLIYDQSPYEIVDVGGQGINLYAMSSLNFQATKELNAKLDAKVQELTDRIVLLEGQLTS